MSDYRRRLGAVGEDLATAWYVARGYEILARNWRCAEGELDLVCRLGPTVVVCEVKTRTSAAFGAPVESVNWVKQLRVRKLGARWLREHRVRCRYLRFDVASVTGGRVRVVERAF